MESSKKNSFLLTRKANKNEIHFVGDRLSVGGRPVLLGDFPQNTQLGLSGT
jgi:hypothetical protein